MKKIKCKTNKNKVNKVLFTIILSVIILFEISNAVTLNAVQDETIPAYNDADKSLVITETIFGNDNLSYSYTQLGGVTGTWIYDYRLHIQSLSSDMYIIYPNKIENDSLQIHMTTFTSTGDASTTTYNITMYNIGTYYFRIRPDTSNEAIRLEINAPNGFFDTVKIASVKNTYVENVNSITESFVTGLTDFIDIQTGLWRLMYYLTIFVIILSTLGLLVGFGLTIYDWAETLGEKKKRMFDMKHKGEK